MAKIKSIKTREILASGGSPTLEVEVMLESGAMGEASVSYGASAGSHEATVLLDKDPKRFGGQGMLRAKSNIDTEITQLLVGMEASDQRNIDKLMIDLDGTEDKSRLGGNAILGVSLAVARAQANEQRLPLYEYLRKAYEIETIKGDLPKPMVVMIEGGKHADNTTDLQEYLVMPKGNKTKAEEVRQMEEIYLGLKSVLAEAGLSTNVGNEGAFAPDGIGSNEKPLGFLVEAAKRAGYEPGIDTVLGIDAAASEFAEINHQLSITNYELKIENKRLTGNELIEYYLRLIEKYPIVTVEDMLAEDDWENWVKLTARLPEGVLNIADDLTVTNTIRWQKAVEMMAANAILIKLNQAGSLTETIDCCKLAQKYGLPTIPSHRGGGESNDTFMVDLAVAMNSAYIKCGPTRGERVAKYNRLMRIEEELR
jgi:enolase